MGARGRVLGAILAGGRSSRFGSDKAVARLGDVTLIEHVKRSLAPQVDAVVVCGRSAPEAGYLVDRPAPDLGPLGGLAAALRHARDHGFVAVVSVGCDTPILPDDLVRTLGATEGPAVVTALPIVGYWPASLLGDIDAFLDRGGTRAVRAWAAAVKARPVCLSYDIPNINTPADLMRLEPV